MSEQYFAAYQGVNEPTPCSRCGQIQPHYRDCPVTDTMLILRELKAIHDRLKQIEDNTRKKASWGPL